MKNILIFVSIFTILLFSCKKDEFVTTTVIGPGICVVAGDIQANYNTCNDTTSTGGFTITLDDVDGVNITFVINSRDLDRTPSNNFEYEDLSYTTQVNNGKYYIELPAISTPYNTQVYFDSYNHNQTSWIIQVDTSYVTTNSINYYLGQLNISDIVEGGAIVKNFTYTY